jgi:hypothetical protein
MKRFLQWRKMTWAILLASTGMAVWVLGSGFGVLSIGVAVIVLSTLVATWYLTQPLWLQGRGISAHLHLRRPHTTVVAFKSAKRLMPAPVKVEPS